MDSFRSVHHCLTISHAIVYSLQSLSWGLNMISTSKRDAASEHDCCDRKKTLHENHGKMILILRL